MTHFDPAAATAAYMATLSPAAHAKATAYTHGGEWLLLWSCLVTVAAAWLILRSGILRRLRDRLNPNGDRPKRTVIAIAVSFVLLDWLIELPWSIYTSWWRERSYQLSSESIGTWFGDAAKALPISLIVTTLFLLALYTLVRRVPRSWWLWASGVAVAGVILLVVITPIFIEPLFNTYTPAPDGPVRSEVVKLAEATGVPHDKILIYNGSKQSDRYTANVAGLFGTARVAMSDTMFKQNADMSEVLGVVGHEMGHYVHKHILWFAAGLSLMAVACFWLIDRLYQPALARIPGTDGIGALSDPAGLPVVIIIFSVLSLLATPLSTTMTRTAESDADRFSLANAHQPDGLAKALVKTIAYRASSPGKLEEILFYDHPSVERRVHRAMVWKAAHPDRIGAPYGPLPPGQ
ncbi:MAG TPA: M48 family metallopeptidase [Sphingomonas sp.]|uniref:M48 family metallopeptidase n=1 Tax=Sphingomonas sp. TaxID=28214 RepID=UPI002CA0D858|nr:M48 family metallopeptidase [Sphingomonas sp.]HMI20033.1 M48 family metallopeptidase [Sphingomonas sp.]